MERLQKVKTDVVKNNYISEETGEYIETETDIKHHEIVVGEMEDFVLVFASIVGLFAGLDNVSIKVLTWAMLNSELNTNFVHFTKPSCEIIEKTCDVKYQTIKNAVSGLVKKGVLFKRGSGAYVINPRYAWRGDTKSRKKQLLYTLTLEKKAKWSKQEENFNNEKI